MERKDLIIIVSISLLIVLYILVFLIVMQVGMPKQICGNGICEFGESQQNCPIDCGYPPGEEAICGDGVCEKFEDEINCPADCGLETTECGDGVCEIPETIESCPDDCKIVQWVLDYRKEMANNGIPINYLIETKDFDYSARNIREVINKIREDSSSAEDAVKRTAVEIYSRIEYVILPGDDCMVNTASEVLEREYGLCSTMSKVNIAVLRGMGIAARPVVGCSSIVGSCRLLAIIPGVRLPKINPIRMENGKAVVGGGIHAWVEVWLPESGWVILESTSGRVYANPLCAKYNIKIRDPQTMDNFCWVRGWDYINSCVDESLFD